MPFFFGPRQVLELCFVPLCAYVCSRFVKVYEFSAPLVLSVVSQKEFKINWYHLVSHFLVRPSWYPHLSVQGTNKLTPKFSRFCDFLSFLHLSKCIRTFFSRVEYFNVFLVCSPLMICMHEIPLRFQICKIEVIRVVSEIRIRTNCFKILCSFARERFSLIVRKKFLSVKQFHWWSFFGSSLKPCSLIGRLIEVFGPFSVDGCVFWCKMKSSIRILMKFFLGNVPQLMLLLLSVYSVIPPIPIFLGRILN